MADGVIGWDAVLEGHLAAEQCKVLASARIGMAGAGGLGSNCAVFLARTGIRDFVIADPDVVALSNLNRQHFFPRHLGLPKVEALGAVLRELNPSVILRLEQRALDGPSACGLFAGCDIVVEAVDDPEVKKNLVEALLLAGHRVVSASRHGRVGRRSDDRPEARKSSRRGWRSRQRYRARYAAPCASASSWPPLWRPMPFWKCCWASVVEALGNGGKVF